MTEQRLECSRHCFRTNLSTQRRVRLVAMECSAPCHRRRPNNRGWATLGASQVSLRQSLNSPPMTIWEQSGVEIRGHARTNNYRSPSYSSWDGMTTAMPDCQGSNTTSRLQTWYFRSDNVHAWIKDNQMRWRRQTAFNHRDSYAAILPKVGQLVNSMCGIILNPGTRILYNAVFKACGAPKDVPREVPINSGRWMGAGGLQGSTREVQP